MKSFRIALYPGDGIGVEVTEATVRVIKALESKLCEFQLEMVTFNWGVDYYDRHGIVVPDDFIQTLDSFDAIFLGAVGFPERLPDHITLSPLIKLRQAFDLYACVRPARTFQGVPKPLAGGADIDLVVVRENSEGEYVNNGGRFHQGKAEEVALQTAVHTRRGIERILRFSFDLAQKRRNRLTMITKSNAQRYGFVLWDEILEEVRADYTAVEVNKQHIDAASMNFVRCPETFDVVVASNLFGDILTDLSGAVTGSLGLNPSANLDPERRHPSLFEPVHGSAPDIAGKGIANPVAAILSGSMMLDWLGLKPAGEVLRDAVERVLAVGISTPDVGGSLTTERVTQSIIEELN
ncbi:MAG: putative tartrate dehydrogenase/decarboxylase TtuC' [Candidatus Moanabacter tarae]|uniref:D-malate dehydrogenase (decarboxylating) n=1 Tax=Candidatus Moanibacter tarae TaxID=2200854 RepID=A0A2Z4AES5_9BACT|nr:MAG: putative tartrate dehydrogenase/decarboxylase TtuC' [Candidatus Moanabacter tarae]|tara:strand:+ start:7579 stop:8631 length:1053 start_codon:yes stop_codon:yes gene_type:complete